MAEEKKKRRPLSTEQFKLIVHDEEPPKASREGQETRFAVALKGVVNASPKWIEYEISDRKTGTSKKTFEKYANKLFPDHKFEYRTVDKNLWIKATPTKGK